MPQEKVFILDEKFTGASVQDNYKKVDSKLNNTVDVLLVTTLDDIAWFLNLRGNDIEFNPVFFSYLLYFPQKGDTLGHTELFINKSKVSDEKVQNHLQANRVEVFEYNEIFTRLKKLVEENQNIGYEGNDINYRIFEIIKDGKSTQKDTTFELIKAVKNPVQMEGMRSCNIKDCAAIAKYFGWLENELKNNPDNVIDEFTGARKVEYFRTEGQDYVGPSFDTISSIGPNGAVIHYKPEKETAQRITRDEIYLLDNGGQYYDGTTDITRTVHFGGKEPTPF